jgi:DNA helicase HerA-like ATPase
MIGMYQKTEVVGYTTSPSSPFHFCFVMKEDARVFVGDFVVVKDKDQVILGQVYKIQREMFPPPYVITTEETLSEETRSVVIAKAKVLGAIGEKGELKSAFPLNFNLPVHIAKPRVLSETLVIHKSRRRVAIGHIVGTDVPIELDMEQLLRGGFLIAGVTGSGKSFTSSILALECAKNGISTIIFDLQNEYVKLLRELSLASKYQINIRVFSPLGERGRLLRIDFAEVGADFFESFLGLTEVQADALDRALHELRDAGVRRPSLEEIYEFLRTQKRFHPVARTTLLRKLERIRASEILKFEESTPLSEIIRPYTISVIELDTTPPELIEMIICWTFNKLLNQKRNVKPTLLILEQADRFIKLAEKVLSLGRRYSLSLGLVSQRPAKLSEYIALCSNAILHKIVNSADLMSLNEYLPIPKRILRQLQDLRVGEVCIIGSTVNFPLIVRVGPA